MICIDKQYIVQSPQLPYMFFCSFGSINTHFMCERVCFAVLSPWLRDKTVGNCIKSRDMSWSESRHWWSHLLGCGKSGRTGWRGYKWNEQTNRRMELRAGRSIGLFLCHVQLNHAIHINAYTSHGDRCYVNMELKAFEIDLELMKIKRKSYICFVDIYSQLENRK